MIDPFAPSSEPQPVQSASGRVALSLYELNGMVRMLLQHTLTDCYWLAAEISELRVASNGHCYLEFVQKDERSGSLLAKARGNIWRQSFHTLKTLFERETGQPLAAGIKVLVQVSITFHELYGYSLNVLDIDPTYTLGDLARRRREIIAQLEEDGVLELNKELPLPRIIRRVAIISSATAAGYGDFCNQLEQSGFAFTTRLFPATMQGDKVEQSVILALDKVAAEMDQWDVVVIIRGGGATTDLNGFDTYLLAANVAQFPLPVLTGIGHERDETILDMVAHTRLKTPTAVAAFLIDSRMNEEALLHDLQQRLVQAAQKNLYDEQQRLDILSRRFHLSASQAVVESRQRFDEMAHRFELAASRYIGSQREYMLRLAARMEVYTRQQIHNEQQRLSLFPQRMSVALDRYFMEEEHRQKLIGQSLRLAGPDRILSLGFSITLKNGKTVRDAAQLKPGDEIVTRFEKGEVKSEVKA